MHVMHLVRSRTQFGLKEIDCQTPDISFPLFMSGAKISIQLSYDTII